ncbi:OmpA family protein [Sinomicrobium sp.]
MKNFIIAFIVFLGWFYLGSRYYLCHVKQLCNPPAAETVVSESPAKNYDTETFNGFVIRKESDSVSLASGGEKLEKSIFDFLNKEQSQEVLITGYHRPEEGDSTGLKRAANLRKHLVTYGINPDRIAIASAEDYYQYDSRGYFYGGMTLEYRDIPNERKVIIEEGIANKILYSHFGSKEFVPDNTLVGYAEELKNYLNKYPEKKVLITGHTDNIGSAKTNEWVGMQRAKNVMNYLVEEGVPQEKIEALSKGPHEPIESNATPEGREKNRRIEIKVD